MAAASRAWARAIRDLTVAAPLKQVVSLAVPAGPLMRTCYPRPDGRGPIEALRKRPRKRAMYVPIRDLTVAAPLKPCVTRVRPTTGNLLPMPYPRPDGRGPIEAVQQDAQAGR